MISVCLVSLSVLRYPHNVTYPSGCPHTLPSQIFARNIIKHDPHHMPAPAELDAFKVCTDYNFCLLDLSDSESDCMFVKPKVQHQYLDSKMQNLFQIAAF